MTAPRAPGGPSCDRACAASKGDVAVDRRNYDCPLSETHEDGWAGGGQRGRDAIGRESPPRRSVAAVLIPNRVRHVPAPIGAGRDSVQELTAGGAILLVSAW